MARRGGFTLIELLVALAVFSLGAMALLNLGGENTRAAIHAETRALGGIVAENRAIEAVIATAPPEPGIDEGRESLAGRDWTWTRTVSPTARPEILRIDVAVSLEGQQAASLTVFRGVEA